MKLKPMFATIILTTLLFATLAACGSLTNQTDSVNDQTRAEPALEPPATDSLSTQAAPSSYTLAWSDEFNGSSVDTSKWNYRTDARGNSVQKPGNVIVGGGVMTIRMLKQTNVVNGKTYNYTGGGLVSKPGFRYGYYETRAKLFDGAGWHPSYWGQRGDGTTVFDPLRKSEIDGFEVDTNNPRGIAYGYHDWLANPPVETHCSHASTTTATAYHTYAWDWQPSGIKFYFDDVYRCTLQYPLAAQAQDDINVWLTSIAYITSSNGKVDDSRLPGSVSFDYFRYYTKGAASSGTVVDNGQGGYAETGSWSDSGLGGYNGTGTRYACGTASATWTPNLPSSGQYAVAIYKIVYPNSDTAADIEIQTSGAKISSTLNYTTASSGWVTLGTFDFAAGSGGYVKNTRVNGCARADAVRFVKQ